MKPILQALLVADHVYTDKTTGKKVVAGIFHRVSFQRPSVERQVEEVEGEERVVLPISAAGHKAGSPFCYISLTEVVGEKNFILQYVSLKDEKVLFCMEFSAKCDDPLRTIEAVFPLPKLPAVMAGDFALELLCDDEILGAHRIQIVEVPTKDHDNGD